VINVNYSRYTDTIVLHNTEILKLVAEMGTYLINGWEPLGPLAQLGKEDSSNGIKRGDWFVAMAFARRVTEYQILSAETRALLQPLVQEAMAQDWRPLGGVAFGVRPNGTSTWGQSMER
jgi:hypothetical protein